MWQQWHEPIEPEMNLMEKYVALDILMERLAPLRRKGRQVVFTNGCFDLLHAGHVRYLTEARALGDLLVIGLNSDRSVTGLKGPRRPIVPQDQRAEVLAGLACVDFVVLFDRPDPGELIKAIVPDVLVKGADWATGEIIGADTVTAAGGRVARIPVVPDVSTSLLIDRIRQRSSKLGPEDPF